jgi:hypothetical protein
VKLEELINSLPANEQEEFLSSVEVYKNALEREKAQAHFMEYIKQMWPGFVGRETSCGDGKEV